MVLLSSCSAAPFFCSSLVAEWRAREATDEHGRFVLLRVLQDRPTIRFMNQAVRNLFGAGVQQLSKMLEVVRPTTPILSHEQVAGALRVDTVALMHVGKATCLQTINNHAAIQQLLRPIYTIRAS